MNGINASKSDTIVKLVDGRQAGNRWGTIEHDRSLSIGVRNMVCIQCLQKCEVNTAEGILASKLGRRDRAIRARGHWKITHLMFLPDSEL